MKKILGLDLGVSSMGWALIEQDEITPKKIIDMGVRIIPLSTEDSDEFSKGNKISKNAKRTEKRTQRKGYDRYQMRRSQLQDVLKKSSMYPSKELFELGALELFSLRAKAAITKVTEQEFGRILLHLNQKRGYKSARISESADNKDTEYVAEVKSRHEMLRQEGITIGQYFARELEKSIHYRVKGQVFPREAYKEEFDAICKAQGISTDLVDKLRDEIIYFQRKLKSKKGLVSICEFEGFFTKDKQGKERFVGPRVAPRSSPIFQVCKMWENVNSIKLKTKKGDDLEITLEQKLQIFNHLNENIRLSLPELLKILGKKRDEVYSNKQLEKGIVGNTTRSKIAEILLPNEMNLLEFNLTISEDQQEVYAYSKETGEVLEVSNRKKVNSGFSEEPFYKLWHTIYSISEPEECNNALLKNFNISENSAARLSQLDLTTSGFGNKSAKAISKILPYLMQGHVYSTACQLAGYNHSNSITKEENLQRKLLDKIPILPKNSLRQPVVEKILNQMIHVVNAISESYGKPDEIRIELARELKQSREERNDTFKNLSKRERENEEIRRRLEKEYGIRPSRNNVIKYRLFHEINNEEVRTNASCIYCGKHFGLRDALSGDSVDVEHIIPKQLLFDDSQTNKTLSHSSCNREKNNRTAYDFMASKSKQELDDYIERVNSLFKDKLISKGKRDKLLLPATKIPKDFIERQIRETQYISKKAKEILEQACRDVWSTSGTVTAHLRKLWGWEDALMNLQLPKYKEAGLTEWVEWETNDGNKHRKEVIKGWTKRDDHRHHAIDALTIACTQQGFIQRINTLNAQHTRDEMFNETKDHVYREKLTLLDRYLISKCPFSTAIVENHADRIAISFKAGKKVATLSRSKKATGKNVTTGVLVPRGPLSEETVYGRIMSIEKRKPAKYLFENPQLIFKPRIKNLVEERLAKFNNDVKAAFASLKTDKIYLDENRSVELQYGTCYKPEIVVKKPISTLKANQVADIVDPAVREAVGSRLKQYDNNVKEAFKNLEQEPIWLDKAKTIPIKAARVFTGLNAVEPVKKDLDGRDIGFVKPGNNHHIAIYKDAEGKLMEHACTFWHAVERKRYGLDVILQTTKSVWDTIALDPEKFPQSFIEKLPPDGLTLATSFQQNEVFLLELDEDKILDALEKENYSLLSKHLYLVWSVAESDYWFKHHLETKNSELKKENSAKESKRFYRIIGPNSFLKKNPIKVRINTLGKIILRN
jgi:CRISPR-associated endonuclease Csn1